MNTELINHLVKFTETAHFAGYQSGYRHGQNDAEHRVLPPPTTTEAEKAFTRKWDSTYAREQISALFETHPPATLAPPSDSEEAITAPERGIVCCFCGEGFGYAGQIPPEATLKKAYEHEAVCPKNPYKLKINRLRDALSALVGATEKADLNHMQDELLAMNIPQHDKTPLINAIHALLATLSNITTTTTEQEANHG